MKREEEEGRRIDPYSWKQAEKRAYYRKALSALTRQHYASCPAYQKLLDFLGYDVWTDQELEQQPMLPVRLFKEYELYSVPREQIVKVMTSSGTSGQKVSKIFLDKENTKQQTKVLTEILSSFLGGKRRPLLILDTKLVLRDRQMFSARGAGIIGFSTFGTDVTYALDESMQLNLSEVEAFLERHQEEPILLFGYTYLIWQYVIEALQQMGRRISIQQGTLFHIGGWKKLQDRKIDAKQYREAIQEQLGKVSVLNYYGMAEQLGSVFVECEYGHLHCSNYSDLIIRRPHDFSIAEKKERGIVELLSLLPTSYPGHVLLTEDEGVILGEDDCPCKRKGKYFLLYGRIQGAEIRGCSDTYEPTTVLGRK